MILHLERADSTWGSDPLAVSPRHGPGDPTMHLRHARWLALLVALGVSGSATRAQPPQPPVDPGPFTVPTQSGPDRIQQLMAGLTAPTSVPSVVPHGPRDGSGMPVGPMQEDRKYGLSVGWLDGLRFYSTDDAF